MEEGGGKERWKREGGGRDGRGRGEGETGGLVIARVHCWCWPSFMRVRFRSQAAAVNGRSCRRPWAPDVCGWVVGARCSWVGCRGRQRRAVRGRSTLVGGGWLSSIGVSAVWCHVCGRSRSSVVRSWQSSGRVVVHGVVVVCGAGRSWMGRGRQWGGRPWALDVCRWVAVVYGGVVHVVCRLWAVMVVHGGVVFISVGAVAVVVVVVCGCSWSCVGVLIIHVGGRRPTEGWW